MKCTKHTHYTEYLYIHIILFLKSTCRVVTDDEYEWSSEGVDGKPAVHISNTIVVLGGAFHLLDAVVVPSLISVRRVATPRIVKLRNYVHAFRQQLIGLRRHSDTAADAQFIIFLNFIF